MIGSRVSMISPNWFRSFLAHFLKLTFFFKFHHSTFGWLRIELCNFFQFSLYGIILISFLRSWVLLVNSGWFKYFFHCFFPKIDFLFQFCRSTLDCLRIKFHNFIQFVFYRDIQVSRPCHEFGSLTCMDLDLFFLSFF
jgi:hypothetical protein